jgi:mono/diheme cytochrome c family protein
MKKTIAAIACGAGLVLSANGIGHASEIRVPDLNGLERAGEKIFARTCVACHGANAGGTDKGPPLIHKYYRPDHHGDPSFHAAVQRGVRQHHWRFGDMPPQPGLKKMEVDAIIRYVRKLQQANGVY